MKHPWQPVIRGRRCVFRQSVLLILPNNCQCQKMVLAPEQNKMLDFNFRTPIFGESLSLPSFLSPLPTPLRWREREREREGGEWTVAAAAVRVYLVVSPLCVKREYVSYMLFWIPRWRTVFGAQADLAYNSENGKRGCVGPDMKGQGLARSSPNLNTLFLPFFWGEAATEGEKTNWEDEIIQPESYQTLSFSPQISLGIPRCCVGTKFTKNKFFLLSINFLLHFHFSPLLSFWENRCWAFQMFSSECRLWSFLLSRLEEWGKGPNPTTHRAFPHTEKKNPERNTLRGKRGGGVVWANTAFVWIAPTPPPPFPHIGSQGFLILRGLRGPGGTECSFRLF